MSSGRYNTPPKTSGRDDFQVTEGMRAYLAEFDRWLKAGMPADDDGKDRALRRLMADTGNPLVQKGTPAAEALHKRGEKVPVRRPPSRQAMCVGCGERSPKPRAKAAGRPPAYCEVCRP